MENISTYCIDNISTSKARLVRYDEILFHPRTGECILSCTEEKHPSFKKRNHLAHFPAVAYHRMQNRGCGMNLRTGELYLGKSTAQYRTIWNNHRGIYYSGTKKGITNADYYEQVFQQ